MAPLPTAWRAGKGPASDVTTQTLQIPPPRSHKPVRSVPYVAALDGVRAVAVAGVLLYHGGVAWMPGGFLGVDLFFVLSGFLITSLLLVERWTTGGIELRSFWIRRARRLFPAAVVVIVVSVVAVAALAPADLVRTRADALASLLYVNNWHQIFAQQSYFAAFGRPSLLRHLWSLSIEEQFYLCWPLLLGLGLKRLGPPRVAWLALVGAAVSAVLMAILFEPGGDPSRVYYGTDTHAVGLLLGAVLAFAWPVDRLGRPRRASAVRVLDGAAVAALVGIVAAMVLLRDYEPFVYRGGIAAVSVAAAVLIAAVAHPSSRVGRVLGMRVPRWIGRRSYGIYLWHWPVMTLTRPGIDVRWPLAVLLPLQIALTVGLAAASLRWIETPVRTGAAQRALRTWLNRRRPRVRLASVLAATLAIVTAVTGIAVLPGGAPDVAPLLRHHVTAAAREDPATAPAQRPSRPHAGDAAHHPRSGGAALAVGASVMLAAQPRLGRRFTVDAAIGRQAAEIVGRLESYRAAGTLPDRVIVQLGENGPVTDDEMRALRHVLRGVSRVVLVNVRVPRSWNSDVNAQLADAAAHWPQARIADWYDASHAPGLLYDDGIHPTPSGQRVYARVVRRALNRT